MSLLKNLVLAVLVLITSAVAPKISEAQNFSSSGQNWSSGWGFASPSDRSLALQQAQAIRQARIEPGPSTVITNHSSTINDARSNYQEVMGEALNIHAIDFQLDGDRIGQNTNSVGSMNTGNTTIDINGANNSINAINSADTQGCVDGSIQQESSIFETMASPSGIDISVGNPGRTMRCTQ